MKIKRFFAKDMRTALLQVKSQLGDDAVIMSNKKVAGGIEIVAAVDNETAAARSAAKQTSQPQHNNTQAASTTKSSVNSKQRTLDEDKVSLQAKADNGSMTKRFAHMLKQYSNTTAGGNDNEPSNADSLSSLLKRQSSLRKEVNGVQLREDSPLARLIAQDKGGEHQPRLDPTRYERNQLDESAASGEDLEEMREEMTSIRRLLEHQVSGLMWQEVERREPLRAMLIKRLERMGVSADLADQLACYIPEDTPPTKAWKALLGLVSDQVPISKQDILKRGGVVALLGPTGVGKTTTVAKLAARAAMEYGSDNVALVTTDTYRIGAHEQLAIYGRIMGCAVKVAKDSKELADVIYQLRNRRLILVDTAGMGQRDVRLSEQLDTLMHESGEVIHSYLVLPATAQRKVLQETIDHFQRIPLSGCILTKLDESLSLGEFVSVVVQNSLPVAYIANGQRVPEDIVIAQPKYMVAKANELLEKSTDNEPHYWNSEAERF
ncbi:flagellar biosynthesis protein FlhF [Vibrio pectenicida]|uniref:Flagellar biosynthesis protein FlhF n=1 Tax=Vibrio pectenicida TaxID=62763 RepID=A0A3R9FQI9_9VIBR|nr:flagellar biosynthesis protein FlhF [Vibrio pectenicida]NOH70707.1 flagellar biosynthesis protein FlhF [Vibrio pectenicida]RSD32007.1 flagellar biosynthesis protein FlhF [Vibrio pectenicida]